MPKVNDEKGTRDNPRVSVIAWGDLRRRMLKFLRGESPKATSDVQVQRTMKRDWEADWEGATKREIEEWLVKGYKPKGDVALFDVASSLELQPSLLLEEEGEELLVGDALSGSDKPFIAYQPAPLKPGLRIVFDVGAACGTSPEALTQFISQWFGPLLMRLETQGYDLELDVVIKLSGVFTDHPGMDDYYDDVIIRVKEANEISDFQGFSPLFSPGGYRTLGFLAIGLAAEKQDKTVVGCLGYPVDNPWELTWDSGQRTLTLLTPNTWHNPPVEEFNTNLKEYGVLT